MPLSPKIIWGGGYWNRLPAKKDTFLAGISPGPTLGILRPTKTQWNHFTKVEMLWMLKPVWH